MSEERERFRAWLDHASPGEAERAADAEGIWASRRRLPHAGWILAAAASIALGLWWVRSSEPEPEPAFASRLVVSTQGDEVRIQVGVRRKEDP